VILACRLALGSEAFEQWGWRIPFLVSIVLLGISAWIRLRLDESPMFKEMKAQGTQSKAPLTESFARWGNLKIVLLALFGLTAGQAVVWYTGQFYALFFLTQTLKVDAQLANVLVATSLLIGTPFFIFFGWLSDRIGRKRIILTGCLLAAATYFPLFKSLTMAANPALAHAQREAPVSVLADPATCTVQFNPVGTTEFTSPCDVAKAALVRRGVPYANVSGDDEPNVRAWEGAVIRIGGTEILSFDAGGDNAVTERARFNAELDAGLESAGYPRSADPARVHRAGVVLILFVLVLYVTMVYGPIAAMLVELFPTRIRYTSMSLPYHIGNGWFGGFLPTTSFAIVAATGDIYAGLWYPVVIALVTVVIGAVFLPETKDVDIAAAKDNV
jgi:MFS family permease